MSKTITVQSANIAGEDQIGSGNKANWSDARGASSGLLGGGESDKRISAGFTTDAGGLYWVDRLFFNFDTTIIPSNAVILSAILKLYFYNTANANINTSSLHIVPSSPADPNNLVSADLNNITFSDKGSLALSSVVGSQYNNITISDLSIIVPGSISTLALINSRDLNNSAPTGRNERSVRINGEANPPLLEIVFVPPADCGPLLQMI